MGPQVVALDQTLTLEVSASDYDGHDIALTASNLPPGAVFAGATNAGTATCEFSYAPQESETGMVYDVTFVATDQDGSSSETVEITVVERLVGFASTTAEVWEQDGTQEVAVVLSRSGDVILELVTGGTAASGADCELVTTQLVFTAGGSATQFVEWVVLEDSEIEAVETVVLALTNVAGAGVAAAGCQTVTIRDNEAALYEPLDWEPGWSMEGQWAFGPPLGGGGGSGYTDPTSGYTGTNVYGVNLAGDYPNNLTAALYLTTTAIDCSLFRNLQFEFQRWLGVESSWYDQAEVQASLDGETWVDLWRHDGSSVSDSAWTNVVFDLGTWADEQESVYFRWGLGPTDVGVHYCGWNIDDVILTGDIITNSLFRFSSSLYSAHETATGVVVIVERVGLTNITAEVDFSASNGTATAGADYDAVVQTLVFAPGERSKTISIGLHDDGDAEGEEQIELRLTGTASGQVADPSEAVLILLDDEAPGTDLPFFDGFESGELADCWTTNSTGGGQVSVGYGNAAPFEGMKQLCMELTNYYAQGLNEAVLTVNLSGQTNVWLDFHEYNGEYNHQAMPASFTGSVEADGVAVSTDGVNWWRLFDPPETSWLNGPTNRSIDLMLFAAEHGLIPDTHFKIKFQHFDDVYRYGRYFDNIQVYDPTRVADVGVAVAVSEDPVEVDSALSYTLGVSNAGPLSATGVILSNQLPVGSGFLSVTGSQGTCTRTGEVIYCELGELGPGASAVIDVEVTALSVPCNMTNLVWVGGVNFDPVTTNNRAETVTAVDERGGTIEWLDTDFEVTERQGNVTLTAIRSDHIYGEVSVAYTTLDGTALVGTDYVASTGLLVFASGQTAASLSISLTDDELDETGESFSVLLSDAAGGAVLGSNTNANILILDDDGRASFPFLETFESGTLTNYWRTYSTAAGRIQITTNNGPANGACHLTMDVADVYGYSLNELILTADLAGQSGVTLSFWHQEFNDYSHSMDNAFSGHQNADGVAVSVDGENWVKVQGLTTEEGSSNEYQRFEVALDPVMAAQGWTYTNVFKIKFQQYDYYWIPYRGFAFDDIALYSKPGALRLSQTAYAASETGGVVTVTVDRVDGTLGEVSVPFSTSNGSAVAGTDYVATNGVLTYADGETNASFIVELLDDAEDESAETFYLFLDEPAGGAILAEPSQAVLTIHDDDGPGTFLFEVDTLTVSESNASSRIYIWRMEGVEGEASVDCYAVDGTAQAGLDYVGTNGTVFFAAGVTSRYFWVNLIDDIIQEDTETIQLILTNASPGAAIGEPDTSELHILDDEDPNYDYYLPAYGKEGAEFRQALHDIIDDHQAFSYTPSLWTILQAVDECPTNAAQVQLVYMQTGRSKNNNGAASGQWNREHVWPQSHGAGNPYGTGDPDPSWPSSVDAHNLKPSDVDINALRGDKDFDRGGAAVAGAPPTCLTSGTTFEPPDVSKGDIARMMFYMDVRYAGDEENEPNLELVDEASTYGTQMGKLSTLLQWHFQDPPDAYEINRNQLIYADWQGNRNPFIDHPEWVLELWEYIRPLATLAGEGGSISPENPEVVYPSGQAFDIQPDPYWSISDIRTNGVSLGVEYGTSSYSFVWSGIPVTGAVEAVFVPDLASQGTPLWWLVEQGFTNEFAIAELADPDDDGCPTWKEYLAGTTPTNAASLLQFEVVDSATAENGLVIRWQSASNRTYRIMKGSNLRVDFTNQLATNIPASPPVNVYTDTVDGIRLQFYRIDLEP